MATQTQKTKRPRAAKPRRRRADTFLHHFYAGQPIPCPVGCGGTADVVRVSTTPSGGGEVWLECMSCAQRERIEAPPATPAEKRRVTLLLKAGEDPICPRHGSRIVLHKRGRQLVCPECGVVYRE